MRKVLSVLLILVIILGGGGYLLTTQADASTPVDPLYNVDLFAEQIQRTFTFDEVKKAELEQDILDERAEELETLLEDASEEGVLGEAVDMLDAQRERAEERVQILMDEDANYDEATLARIQTRLETQLQTQLQNMERVQEQFQEKTFENEQAQENFQKAADNFDKAQQNFQEAVQKMNDAKSNGNSEQNVDDDAGDGINNRESNSNR
jgi:hypothetical protein